MMHIFNVEAAKSLGVNAAIVLANLAHLQQNREAQGGEKYYIEGRWWVHHTYESLQKIHPYFSLDQLRRIMKGLLDKGAVFRSQPDSWNRDSYWSVASEFMQSAKSPDRIGEIAASESAKSPVVLHEYNIEQKRGRFTPPTREELISYVDEKGYYLCDPDVFLSHYEANGWKIGRNKMVSWSKAAAGWHHREKKKSGARPNGRI